MIATKNTTHSKRTPYCDTCYRKGLSEREYTSHYTKSRPFGVVVCPTILNTVCRFCGMKGHWASEKFCPLMRRERRQNDRKEQEQKMASKLVAKKATVNVYTALMDHEGEAVYTPAPKGSSWADMAAKPAVLAPKVEEPSILTPLHQISFNMPPKGAEMNGLERLLSTSSMRKGLKSHTVYYDSKDTKYEPLMTDAEREAYKILNERQAAGCFDKRNSWLDLSDDEEEW